jgi:hypothetical protein
VQQVCDGGTVPSEQALNTLVVNVRFGSKADMCGAKSDVRFTPDSDRESGFPQTAMSALPPKADVCGALANVCYGPKADIGVKLL